MNKLFVILVGLALVACGNTEVPKNLYDTVQVPEHAIGSPGGYYVYTHSITMKDGTRCVLVAANSQGGAAISCDWKK